MDSYRDFVLALCKEEALPKVQSRLEEVREQECALIHREPIIDAITGRGSNATHGASFPPTTTRARGRGRGRGFVSQAFNETKTPPSATHSRTSSPAPSNQRDFMNAAIDRFTVVRSSSPSALLTMWIE